MKLNERDLKRLLRRAVLGASAERAELGMPDEERLEVMASSLREQLF